MFISNTGMLAVTHCSTRHLVSSISYVVVLCHVEHTHSHTNIHKFKEMLDIWRYGDRTLRALLELSIIQLDKYTYAHTHNHMRSSQTL